MPIRRVCVWCMRMHEYVHMCVYMYVCVRVCTCVYALFSFHSILFTFKNTELVGLYHRNPSISISFKIIIAIREKDVGEWQATAHVVVR